jgi:hypothetical protein
MAPPRADQTDTVQTATTVFARRQIPFDTIELNLLSAVYAMTAHQRQNM